MQPRIIPNEVSLSQPFRLGIGSVLITTLILAIFWVKLPAQVPLFYSRTTGGDQLTNPLFLLLPPILSGIFLLMNLVLTRFTESDFLKRALVLGAVLSSILASITVIRIIFLIA
ncbi:MAG: hypothetical protein Q7S60_03395 [bacterium]|nr:hypothetical protein [bacterium]